MSSNRRNTAKGTTSRLTQDIHELADKYESLLRQYELEKKEKIDILRENSRVKRELIELKNRN